MGGERSYASINNERGVKGILRVSGMSLGAFKNSIKTSRDMENKRVTRGRACTRKYTIVLINAGVPIFVMVKNQRGQVMPWREENDQAALKDKLANIKKQSPFTKEGTCTGNMEFNTSNPI